MPSDSNSIKPRKNGLVNNPVFAAIGQMFYLLGFYAECKVVMVGRGLRSAGGFIGQLAVWLFGGFLRRVGRFFKALWRDFTQPFTRFFHGMRNIRTLVREERRQGGAATRKAVGYFGSGVKAYIYLVLNFFKLLLPLAAAVAFVFTVYTVMSMRYVLSVEVNGQIVGYIADQETFEQARNMIRDRIVPTEDFGVENFTLTPTLRIATASNLNSVNQLTNNMLLAQNLDDEYALAPATGIYLDGAFAFATTDIEGFEDILEDLLAPYRSDDDDESVTLGFVREPTYDASSEQLFFVGKISDIEEIRQMVNTVVEPRITFEANGEVSLNEIAGLHDISLPHLLAYNPDYIASIELEEDEEYQDVIPEAGTVLVVQLEQKMLQVRKTLTTWREEDWPYQTYVEENDNLSTSIRYPRQNGIPGLRRVFYYVDIVDGIRTEMLADDIPPVGIEEPVDEIIVQGTREGGSMGGGGGGTGAQGGSYTWPVPAYTYCYRGYSAGHRAQDINAPTGTMIIAAQGGTVITSGWHPSYGYYIEIDHGGGVKTLYAHCSELWVAVGDLVDHGSPIGAVGSTGNSTGPHCHFEVVVDGVRVDPLLFVTEPG